ncbi:uncharacterized protein F4812DRAFT_442264 [Daldinia caldariorum]|uniref:uncharacterized protein n=1 Tax=Daldinia caldariorum TaxID=326644 RepID=UPI002007BDD3|nr:uncharacterized protein F4812DRAFT_442264 [Daldinia caldariorum]KAI1464472.1 hypothetical protein F4812DRAFT_442264 [Daldinia caldariorum]
MDLDSTGSRQAVTLASGPRKSVPYGQACTNCSKAKCKCISRVGAGSGCERCQRLGKECIPSISVRKRAAKSKTKTDRTAHLEEKLDDLVSILRAQAVVNPPALGTDTSYRPTSNSGLPSSSASVGSNANAATTTNAALIGVVPNGNNLATTTTPTAAAAATTTAASHTLPLPPPVIDAASYSAASYPTPPSVASSHDGGLSPAEAEDTLRVFRDQFLPFFPFVYLPPDTTAAQLQLTKPFLWLNIMTICCKSQPRKSVFSKKIKEYLAQKMLVDLDRNMDLLLGLLAYLGWGMHHFSGKPYIVAYMNLSVTIVTDLRLDKPAQDNFYKDLHCFRPSYPYPKIPISTTRTNEERRATLACFILCSSISNFLRTQTMRWTAHMEDSLQKLAANPEWIGDEVLVAMVRTYKIHEDVAQITWRTAEPAGNSAVKAPPAIYVKALRANLDAIRKNLPPSLLDNKIINSHLYSAELSIADMSLWNVNAWLSTHPHRPQGVSNSGSGGIDLGKIDAYYASLQASKACLENFLRFDLSEYPAISFSITLQFGRAAQTLYRLMIIDDAEWDRSIVKNSIDMMAVLEQAANNFAQVSSACGLDNNDDPDNMDYYSRASLALRSTIPVWSSTVEQANIGTSVGSAVPEGPGVAATAAMSYQVQAQVLPELAPLEWFDDPWLSEVELTYAF